MLALLALVVPEVVAQSCVVLNNFQNTQYTVPITVGTKQINVIPDTGSFELIVPSTRCEGVKCAKKNLYDADGPSTTRQPTQPEKIIDTHFGQGSVRSIVFYDSIKVGDKTAPRQSVLAMKQHSIKNYELGSYDGIMGLGKRDQAREGDSDTALLQTLDTHAISICLGKNDGEGGVMYMGDGLAGHTYNSLPVIGQQHWALQLQGVGTVNGQASVCGDGKQCAAVIDSGTSLIAAPKAALDVLSQQVGEVKEDCSNRDSLPTLWFNLAGQWFAVPPQTYVAKISNVDEMGSSGVGMWRFKYKTGHKVDICVPLFMDLSMQTESNGPMWILGMPFLRQYSAKFHRGENGQGPTIGLSEVQGNPCASCAGHQHLSKVTGSGQQQEDAHSLSPGLMGAVPTIDARNVLVPDWAMNTSEAFIL